MRAFDVRYPKRKRGQAEEKDTEGSISLVGKSSLLRPHPGPKPETYQRLLRLSPAQRRDNGSRRIGAVASGLAKLSELVAFDATRSPPREPEIITRIGLQQEAADLDIAETPEGAFSMAWCSDYNLFEQTIEYDFKTRKSKITPSGPRLVYGAHMNIDGKFSTKPKYRSIRFLTPHHVLILGNRPNKSGAELSIIHLYPTGPAALVCRQVLPTHVKQGMGMDVCALDPDKDGSRQFAIAVGGQDISINVYTTNYTRSTDTYTPFKKFTTLHDVHPLQMTALTFSRFHSPQRAVDANAGAQSHPPPQYTRLASVSMGNTVVVDTFALSPLDPKDKNSRYMLSHPSTEKWTQAMYIGLISFMVLISAFMIQSYFAPPQTSALSKFLPPGARQWVSSPADVAQSLGEQAGNAAISAIPTNAPQVKQRLRDILHLHESNAESTKAVILRSPQADSSELSVDVVPDREAYLKQDMKARRWHELEEHERQTWKEALIKAGEWTVEEGEAIFKGVIFSSYAGFVGQVAAEAING